MILLQVCLPPLSILLLLGAIFMIGASGVETPKVSSWQSQDASWMDRTESTWMTDSTGLPAQSPKNQQTLLDEAGGSWIKIMRSNPASELRSELPLYKR